MEENERRLLDETVLLARENNRLLRKIVRRERLQAIWATIKLLVIVSLAFGAYYYIQPYILQLIAAYRVLSGSLQGLEQVQSNLQTLPETIRSLGGL
jgi:hypothetical protein